MVHFGVRIEREQRQEWADHYIDYHALKDKLKAIIKLDEKAPKAEREQLKAAFQGSLDAELEKVLAFYRERVGGLEAGVSQQEASGTSVVMRSNDPNTVPSEKLSAVEGAIRQLRPLALEVFYLLGYVSLNMTAVRKILKKFAKQVETSAPRAGMLALRIEHPHDPKWKLLQGTTLPAAKGVEVETMQGHAKLSSLGDRIKELYERLLRAHDMLHLQHPELPKPGAPAPEGAGGRALFKRQSTFKYTPKLRPLEGEGPDPIEGMAQLLEALGDAERAAQRNANLIHPLSWEETQAGIFEPAPEDDEALATFGGLLLNCINSGLYMANYNLIIPSITSLCAHIGVGNSTVGIIIGSCDIATVVATMGYSVWTSGIPRAAKPGEERERWWLPASYKAPLIASAFACLVGNLAYCLSYDLRALWLLMLARLVTGFGSARTVNRRYIAMYVARQDRTRASALFVSLSAVGMAAGPLLALPLQNFGTYRVAGVTLNNITVAGWIMNVAWLLFAFCGLWFEDPLQVLAKRKAARGEITARAADGGLTQPLLSDIESKPTTSASQLSSGDTSDGDEEDLKPAPWADHPWERLKLLWASPFVATFCCCYLCFILKVNQQAYIDGLPIFTGTLYGWDSATVGIMLGILGLAAPIVNTSVGQFSFMLSDRLLTVVSIVVTGVGSGLLMRGAFPRWGFFTGGVAVYMGTIVLEAVSMSLTSKVIDERLASGLWNAGLLSTQAGTIGRFCGNLLLSLCANITSAKTVSQVNKLAVALFGASGVFMIVSLAFVLTIYRRLAC